MKSDLSQDKVEAIYELREAVESKVHAEVALEAQPSAERRDVLLDAQLDVEAKTQNAIEACHECGYEHISAEPHRRPSRVGERKGNVLGVDFRPTS